MNRRCMFLAICAFAFSAGACNFSNPPATTPPTADTSRAKDLVGKWKLVRAGGKPAAELGYVSQEVDIAADGTWSSKVAFKIPQFGAPDNFTGLGKWSLDGDELSYEYGSKGGLMIKGDGANSGKTKIRFESGRLIVEPDCFMQVRLKGVNPMAGEYVRQ